MNDFILHFPIEYSHGFLNGAVFAGNWIHHTWLKITVFEYWSIHLTYLARYNFTSRIQNGSSTVVDLGGKKLILKRKDSQAISLCTCEEEVCLGH